MEKMVATLATAAFLSTAFSSTALASSYTVQKGDTLFSIAKKHGTTVDQLKQLNGLTSNQIYVNQKLQIASTETAATDTAVTPAASTPAPAPAPAVNTASASYTVAAGDTLSKIAFQHGITLAELRALNGISGDLIYSGQVLKVPAGSASTGTSAPSSAPAASGSTYTVAAGDTLIKIANRYGVSLAELKSWNGISGSLIHPGQVLSVGGSSPSVSAPPVAAPTHSSSTPTNAGTSEYVIKSGDTLAKIALQVGLNVTQLKALNGLSSDLIFPGQTLKISGTASANVQPVTNNNQDKQTSVAETANPTIAQVLQHATKLIGTPYVFGGKTPAGFDCSGFIYYVFNQAGESITRLSAAGYYDRSFDVSSPQVGDLVFFKDTYIKGISHLGIYLGNNEFIHAGSNGVDITSLDNVYWKKHFDSFKRFY